MLARLVMPRISVLASVALAAGTTVALGVGPASAAAGTSVSATITATGHRAQNYRWSLGKSVDPPSQTVQPEGTASPTWTVSATRTVSNPSAYVSGNVCVTNTGAVATSGLAIVVSRSKPTSKTVLSSVTVPLGSASSIAAGKTACYPYSMNLGANDLGLYKYTASVSIQNKPSGKSNYANPSATASVPATTDIVNNEHLDVADSNGETWTFTSSGSHSYSTDYSCPTDDGEHENTVEAVHYVETLQNATPVPASATFTLDCAAPELEITKVADAETVNAGEDIGFTVAVKNIGNAPAEGVHLTDFVDLASGVQWSGDRACAADGDVDCFAGELAAGDEMKVHITGATSVDTCGTIENTANFTSYNAGSGSASASVMINCPDLTITKEADATEVSAGEDIGYTITVTNNGDGDATDVMLEDDFFETPGVSWAMTTVDDDCTLSGGFTQSLICIKSVLPAGESFSVHVTSPTTVDTCLSQVLNIAQLRSPVLLQTDRVYITVLCPDLSITKEADARFVSAGEDVGYTITVSNSGDGKALGIQLHDLLPLEAFGLDWSITDGPAECAIVSGELTCNDIDLDAGGSFSVHVTSATDSEDCGILQNQAYVSAPQEVYSETVLIDVQCPDLALTKTASSSIAGTGDTVTWTIMVTNNGSGTASDVVVTDTLGIGITLISTSGIGATCTSVASTITCTAPSLVPSASLTITVTTTVLGSCISSAGDNRYNQASVTASNESLFVTSDNTDSDFVTVYCET